MAPDRMFYILYLMSTKAHTQQINKYMNKHSIVKLKCPCLLFRYPNLDIPNQALFNLHRASTLPLRCDSEDDKNFQSPPGHSMRPVTRRRYCLVPVWHSATLTDFWWDSCAFPQDWIIKMLLAWETLNIFILTGISIIIIIILSL